MIKYYTTPVLYKIYNYVDPSIKPRTQFGIHVIEIEYNIEIGYNYIQTYLFTKNARLNGSRPTHIDPRGFGCYSWCIGMNESSPLSYRGLTNKLDILPLSPFDERYAKIREEFGIPKHIFKDE